MGIQLHLTVYPQQSSEYLAYYVEEIAVALQKAKRGRDSAFDIFYVIYVVGADD